MSARYDAIGTSYAQTRHEDPRLAERLHAALGDARTVLNVGAGTGSYEPTDRHVIAVEPSAVMIAQRGSARVPAIQASAEALPLVDGAVDASMAIITIHHWDAAAGIAEMRRVTRGPVLILTFDPRVSREMWLVRDYLPEVAALDDAIFPLPEEVAAWLDGDATIEPILVPADTPDWTLASFWAHPERVLDPVARAGTSGFARQTPQVNARVADAVRRDLADGTWDARNGHLRALDEYDAGLRLIVGQNAERAT